MISVTGDVGKSSIRLLVESRSSTDRLIEVPSPASLGDENGYEAVVAAIVTEVAELPVAGEEVQVAIGIAGAAARPGIGQSLFNSLRDVADTTRLILTSDAVVAHLSAFGGGGGTVLVAGTGSVALSIEPDASPRFKDGNGPRFGDDGSGAWIGGRAVRAVIQAAEGRAPSTRLTALLEQRCGLATPELLRHGNEVQNPARWAGQFAPDVMRAWEEKDPAATWITQQSIQLLTATALASRQHSPHLSLTGGLTRHAAFADALRQSIARAASDLLIAISATQPLVGARALFQRDQLPIATALDALVREYRS